VTGIPALSIVVPAYNEERRLVPTLARITGWLAGEGRSAEVLVVDDGSRDDTARVAERALAFGPGRVVRLPENRGKGAAVRAGVLASRGKWILLTDADLSTPIEDLPTLEAAVRAGGLDVAIGSRALAASRVEVRQGLLRQTMGKTFNRVIRVAAGLPFGDTQCGFKLFDGARARPIFAKMVVDRFAFDVEFLFLAHRAGLRIAEVPVVWRNAAESKVKLVGDPLNMLADVARVRWRHARGRYR